VINSEQFAVDSAGRGDYSREEGTAMVRCKVRVTVFGDLFPSPKIERTVESSGMSLFGIEWSGSQSRVLVTAGMICLAWRERKRGHRGEGGCWRDCRCGAQCKTCVVTRFCDSRCAEEATALSSESGESGFARVLSGGS
jgi:hypothetical protein